MATTTRSGCCPRSPLAAAPAAPRQRRAAEAAAAAAAAAAADPTRQRAPAAPRCYRRNQMSPVPVEQHYAELVAATTALAALVDHADPDLAVPACPGCTLRQLATHVGRAHRWAGEIVLTSSAEFIEFRPVPGGRLPDDQARPGPWLIRGPRRL